jgi:hypothetical protein
LKSFPGASAHILPQLLTANQDSWWTTSDTWLDRTADLRVLLNRGSQVIYEPQAKYAEASPGPSASSFTPAVWVRGAGNWLNRDATATTKASGRPPPWQVDRMA